MRVVRMLKRVHSFGLVVLLMGLVLIPWSPAGAVEQGKAKKVIAPVGTPAAGNAQRKEKAAAKSTADAAQAKSAGVDPSPGQINARAAILLDVATGTVLFEQNADEIIEPASFTKILSLYLIFEALQQGRLHMTDEIWISREAWKTGGSKMFVGVDTKVPLEELIKGIAVVSGNDACMAVAEHLGGSIDAFVESMNAKAAELGMAHSRFMNPHGLPADGQITTARDMATLDSEYLRRFPESIKFHSMHEFSYNNITQANRNHLLLKDSTVDGLKTGYVTAAGYHLSATAQRDGMRLLAVVMGAASPAVREREALKLLNFGFRFYSLVQPFPPEQPLKTVKVWKGAKDDLNLYAKETPSFLIPQTQRKQLRWEIRVPEELTAPVKMNQPVGEVVFYVSDQIKKTIPVIAREDVEPGGWFKRTWQTVIRLHTLDWRWFAGIGAGLVLLAGIFLFFANRRPRTRSF